MLIFKKIKSFPTHIAFIMDGNRRWAAQRGLNKMLGHREGAKALKEIVLTLAEIEEIKFASFFAFSTENWKRSKEEIDGLFEMIEQFAEENENLFKGKNIKLVVMGDVSKFPSKMRNALTKAVEESKQNTGLVVNLALNYGGRDDIVRAANRALEKGQKIDENTISENLYSYPSPDVDLLIRTSGEMRVSNFMLYQMAYSELYFTKTYWPDFDKKALYKALLEYSKRNRRFGGK